MLTQAEIHQELDYLLWYGDYRGAFDFLSNEELTQDYSSEEKFNLIHRRFFKSEVDTDTKIVKLGALLQQSFEKITRSPEDDGEKRYIIELLRALGTALKSDSVSSNKKEADAQLFDVITENLNQYFDPQLIELELIETGVYQKQLYDFTYNHKWRDKKHKGETFSHQRVTVDTLAHARLKDDCPYPFVTETQSRFNVYPVMDQPGLRCTAALPTDMQQDGPIELQLNFFGTIDWASKSADVDSGGPGQKILKKHEQTLLKNLNDMIASLSEQYPGRLINLRISGHSLGGSLAKGFAHSIQRAIAVQDNEPEAVVGKITKKLMKKKVGQKRGDDGQARLNHKTERDLERLKQQLKKDRSKFANMEGLKKLNQVTLYALGSPGVSKKTDDHATLLTYFHHRNFLRAYNHFHEKDLITKFGEREFLSGRKIPPNIVTNKNVVFRVTLTEEEIKGSGTLPFPGITEEVMAVHNKMIACHNRISPANPVKTAVFDIHSEQSPSQVKFHFHPLRVFFLTVIIKSIAAIVGLFQTSKVLNPAEHIKTSAVIAGHDASKPKECKDPRKMYENFKSVVRAAKLSPEEQDQSLVDVTRSTKKK